MAAQWESLAGLLDHLTDEQCARLLMVYRLGVSLGRESALLEAAQPLPAVDCDWEHGICCCPGCGAVVQVVNRPHKPAKVTDGDGREHYCERQVTAVFQRYGVAGMESILQRHADRAPLVAPALAPAPRPTPDDPSGSGPARRALDV